MENPAGLWKQSSCLGKTSAALLVMIVLIALLSPYLSPYSFQAPSGPSLEPPGSRHWLGTDDLGIDLWAQICSGARISIIVGFGTALLAGVGGTLAGMLSGYYGGWTDRILMRMTDMMLVLPDLPMMIVLGAFFGPSLKNIILVLALFSWTGPARIVRSRVLSLRQAAFIRAARCYGAGFCYLSLKHFLPAILPLVLVSMIRLVSKAVVAEAGLAFLGLGDPTSKSWGLILNHAINFSGIYFTDYWQWWLVSPLAAITLFVVAVAFLAREVEKLVDTKL
ncbi:ABC transporter permease [Candidatus Formimonas warabiya]|uniref:Peptide ABC transporter permease n=1 Tax=Formimonas warabiya TaxID=1761012 RepID=A0A3G1KYM0_FORW1|nr:ABC transporter permease [Candidatus Formimonas warabiya]ATW27541.1 peptide ABC transporter permease [Candidatus Formimonas warabiya]